MTTAAAGNGASSTASPSTSLAVMSEYSLELQDGRTFSISFNSGAWSIQDERLFKNEASGPILVATCIVVVLGRKVDLDSGNDQKKIQFAARGMRGGVYQTWTFDLPAAAISDPKTAARLMAEVHVYTLDGWALCAWIHDQIRHNDITPWPVSTHCGWFRVDGQLTFIAPGWQSGPEIAHDEAVIADYRSAKLHRPGETGSAEEWRQGVAKYNLARFPIFGMALGTAVGAVVAGRLEGTVAFTLEMVAERQSGKTALARFVEAFFGRPGTKGIELSMSMSRKGAAVLLSYLYCIPMFADDETAATAGEQDLTAGHLAYIVFNGGSRVTTDPSHCLHEGGTWKTTAIVTSESPMLRDEKRGGASARCFTVMKHPFATWDEGKGAFIDKPEAWDHVEEVIQPLARYLEGCWGHGLRALVDALRLVSTDIIQDAYDTILRRVVDKLKGHSLAWTTAREITVTLLGLWALETVLGWSMEGVARAGEVESAMIKIAWEREEQGGIQLPALVAWREFMEWAPQQVASGKIMKKGEGPALYSRNEVYGVWDLDAGAAGDGVGDAGSTTGGTVGFDAADWLTRAVSGKGKGGAESVAGDLFVTIYGIDAFLFRSKLPMSRPQLVEVWGKLGLLEERTGTGAGTKTRYPDIWARASRLPKTQCPPVMGYLLKAEKLRRDVDGG